MRRNALSWLHKHGKPCKIGTVPMCVQVHGSDWRLIAVGKRVRVKEQQGDHWSSVLVTRVDDSGYFMADK